VMLASLPPESLEDWLTSHSLKRSTPSTITSAAALREDLRSAAKRGYSITRGESVADVMALAAPVRFGGSLLGIAVAGPLARMEAAERRVATKLVQTARSLERIAPV
jgi:IclR family transcriptional regulator, acetate operon repressor